MTDPKPAELDVSRPRQSFLRNLSFVWLVPILALVLSLAIAWRSYSERGALIEISLSNASGVTAGETTIRYRDVVVGVVEDVDFTTDLSRVVLSARIDKTVADLLPEEAMFWVVRPEVTAQRISGLSTVFSGVYIEASFKPSPGGSARSFEGLDDAPLTGVGEEGTYVTIRARDGNRLSPGAPVLYRGIEVGRIETPHLSDTGDSVVVGTFIAAPYDRFLTTATRFWDTSGFSVSLGAAGINLEVGNLSSLVTGGIAFDTLFSGGEPVEAGSVFELFADEQSARQSLVSGIGPNAVRFSIDFDGSVEGLTVGSPIEYRGLRVGEVSAIAAFLTETTEGQRVRLRATVALDPQAMGLPADAGTEESVDFLASEVEAGLRARLAPANLFSSALIIELAETPDAPPATLGRPEKGYPVLPSVQVDLPDFTATAEGVFERINALPVEELIDQAISVMASIEAVATAEGTRAMPDALVSLIEDSRALVASEETQALPGEIRAAIAELRGVVDELRARGAIDRLVSALENADAASANLSTASERVPALIEDLRALAAKANELGAEELVASATRVLDSANALIGTDEARALPPALTAALGEVEATLSELREGGAVENANATLTSTRAAADAVAEATAALPELSARLDALIAQSERLVTAYGAQSNFNADALAALREVRAAARTIAQLARAIERNPNSLIIGR
ncbi:MlaD family protein [Defluviimonas sp. WL0002]|uniref:MlaD family protein n=1 Tax=Albidovulum marisflavi TaxID=2984159 RepID=A0ABT2ZEM7_9RHOB|nr:MlaD family protein [Defluviimonas sp. WL0002]MCV2869595.1 MlaD family protein [Defluviimonas sp. WL0002]